MKSWVKDSAQLLTKLVRETVMRHRYYYDRLEGTFQFLVPRGAKILYYGSGGEGVFPELYPKACVVVDQAGDRPLSRLLRRPDCVRHRMAFDDFTPDGTFDYIILNAALGEAHDICRLLERVRCACGPRTRVVMNQHNYLWEGLLTLGGRVGLKSRERTQNWLSLRDLENYLKLMGFDVVRSFRRTLLPARLVGLGQVVNHISELTPGLSFLKLDQIIVARAQFDQRRWATEPSLTICLTVRDERGNVAPIIQSIPRVCKEQEILFVEGHSSDGTRAEIERAIKDYPCKNVRVTSQAGFGQGDAIRVGFRKAKGDIIILYEGDGTADPADIPHYYAAMRAGRCEFIEGSRFVYPLDRQKMPTINRVGNILFALWFSYFLGQTATDVLSGIKAIGAEDFRVIDRHWGFVGVEDPFGDFELLYGAARFGLSIGELPMRYRRRPYGETKTRVVSHGFRLFRLAARGYRVFRGMVISQGLHR